MEFRIADTFSDSLARLTGEEQKAVKTTAFDLQLNPAQPGMQLHKLDRAKDRNFWSVRVSRDLRLIVHRTAASLLLCYVDHHDAAYRWAERRKLERHPKTGSAQLVEIRETVREIEIPRYVEVDTAPPPMPPKPELFAALPDGELLGYGVPEEWLGDVRRATEDTLLELADHLPGEAAEALLEIATGSAPQRPIQVPPDMDPFSHPDAQRRFRVMANAEELERALEYPWEKWTVFLHPAQRRTVERDYSGPARVAGSAGTGKTIVALHRAVHLARTHRDTRVLLATFSEALANALRVRLRRLIGNEPRIGERLEVHALGGLGRQLYEANFGPPRLAGDDRVRALLTEAAAGVEGHRFSSHFLWTEWADVVDAWQLETWEDYRDVKRLGRKTRLAEKQRAVFWSIFAKVRTALIDEGLVTQPGMFRRLEAQLETAKHPAFDYAVIDEAQDVGVAELRFLAALAGDRANGLFFAGDLGQRIFQTPFSWRSLGVDVRGRSQTLRINYRTSHQIRRQADRLLPGEVADVDGNNEERRGTVSIFNGPEPTIRVLESVEAESGAIAEWLRARSAEGFAPHEIGVFVRSRAELPRAAGAVRAAGLAVAELDDRGGGVAGSVAVGTMHLAKGLEFRAVVVAACDDEIVPLQSRIQDVADEADLEDVYDTERHLLYVACTRARDQLLVTGVDPASEFLEDLRGVRPGEA
jgi:mRNA-degrading endonuclease RelE of RelBE toxin-antitoxin system